MLDAGQSYSIEDYRDIGSTVTIMVDSISDDMKDATINISATPPPPTDSPTFSCNGDDGRCKVVIDIDDVGKENSWKLFEKNSNILVEEGMAIEKYLRNQQYIEPNDDMSYCLDPGCYNFEIYDSYGDGLLPEKGGYYRGILNDKQIFAGAKFELKDTRTFCVVGFTRSPTTPLAPTVPPTKPPTIAPTTKSPTIAPAFPTIPPTTECFDDGTLLY